MGYIGDYQKRRTPEVLFRKSGVLKWARSFNSKSSIQHQVPNPFQIPFKRKRFCVEVPLQVNLFASKSS
jgi:hypothetical protein